MGRPINKKNFGNGAGKLAIKFYDGSAVVIGKIVSQIGSRKFKVTKADGTGGKIVRLAQTASELTALTAGTGGDAALRPDLGTIEVVIFNGGATENVKAITTFKVSTIQGTTVKFALGVSGAANGDGTIAAVAQIALTVGTVIPGQVGTVAGAFSYQIPANAFTGGNLPLTYSIATQAGFVISSDGLLTKAAGASTVGAKAITVTVTDADGTTATAAAFNVTLS
jgi:hypothetical protein